MSDIDSNLKAANDQQRAQMQRDARADVVARLHGIVDTIIRADAPAEDNPGREAFVEFAVWYLQRMRYGDAEEAIAEIRARVEMLTRY